MALGKRGCDIYAIDPDPLAVRIGHAKAKLHGIAPERFLQSTCEALPFANNSFEFVWCDQVLEHVHDVRASVSEMVRVVRPRGRIFIAAPDYRQVYEHHYKLTMPLFAPRWLLRAWLFARGRPTTYLSSLQFVNSRMLANLFQDEAVTAFQVLHSWPADWRPPTDVQRRLVKWITQTFGIQRDQFWLLHKLERPR